MKNGEPELKTYHNEKINKIIFGTVQLLGSDTHLTLMSVFFNLFLSLFNKQ